MAATLGKEYRNVDAVLVTNSNKYLVTVTVIFNSQNFRCKMQE